MDGARDVRLDGKRLLTSGQMARENCISKKTLRFYQEKGILEPTFVDEKTGFRYYSYAQASRLDMILQLQAAGFSIDEIADLLHRRSMGHLRERAREKLDQIIEERRRLSIAQRIATEVVDSCDAMHNVPLRDQIVLESIPARRVLEFELPPYEDIVNGEDLTDYEGWELMVRHVKQRIVENRWPLALLRNVCSLTPKDRLRERYAWRERIFVLVDEAFGECCEHATTLKGGLCLSLYTDAGYDENESYIGHRHVERILDYAEHKNLEAAGDLFTEPINRLQRFFDVGGRAFARYCLPVEPRSHAGGPTGARGVAPLEKAGRRDAP